MNQVTEYLARNRNLGISSRCMGFVALGWEPRDKSHPYDPADLNRCLLLVRSCPQVLQSFNAISELSPQWKAVIENWDELERLFVAEVGWNWSKGKRAKRTYDRMQSLFRKAAG